MLQVRKVSGHDFLWCSLILIWQYAQYFH